MHATALNKEIQKYLSVLASNQRAKVLEFLKSLSEKKKTASSDLSSFAGTIPTSDLEDMKLAIDKGCEHIV